MENIVYNIFYYIQIVENVNIEEEDELNVKSQNQFMVKNGLQNNNQIRNFGVKLFKLIYFIFNQVGYINK